MRTNFNSILELPLKLSIVFCTLVRHTSLSVRAQQSLGLRHRLFLLSPSLALTHLITLLSSCEIVSTLMRMSLLLFATKSQMRSSMHLSRLPLPLNSFPSHSLATRPLSVPSQPPSTLERAHTGPISSSNETTHKLPLTSFTTSKGPKLPSAEKQKSHM